MKKRFLILLSCCFIISNISFAQSPKINSKEFKLFIGAWQGSLTYLDYSSNTKYSMPANVNIEQIKKTNQFIFFNSYPDEPNANSNDTLTISKNGKFINEETIKSKHLLKDGNTEITTEYLGIDGNENKPALIRHTYTIGKNIFTKQKDIQFVGQSEWINRHIYSYKRKVAN